jgi:recombination protein RecA
VDGYATRAARLDRVLEALRARFGDWIIYRLREARPAHGAPALSTGSLGLDRATGLGGLPRGRLTELSGPPTSGKRALAAHVLADAQRGRGFAALLDADHAADFGQLRRCGVDLADLLLVVPCGTREALDIAGLLVASRGLDALVLAAANGLLGGPFADRRAFAPGLRRLLLELASSPTAVVVLVHRDAAWRADANPARQLAHAATLRIACTPLGLVTHASGEVLGLRLRAEVVKNRLAAPGGTAELEVRRDHGVHAAAELLGLGLADGLVGVGPDAVGYWFGDRWLGRGREAAVGALEEDPALRAALRRALRGGGP